MFLKMKFTTNATDRVTRICKELPQINWEKVNIPVKKKVGPAQMESIQRSRLENSKAMSRMRTELACEECRYLNRQKRRNLPRKMCCIKRKQRGSGQH